MNPKVSISSFVDVTPRYSRSVNLSKDWDAIESSRGYIVTENVTRALEQICFGLTNNLQGQRAFSLIGPYGTGKSAFSVFLCQVLSKNVNSAKNPIGLLSNARKDLAIQLEAARRPGGGSQEGFLPIVITSRRRPIAQLMLEGLQKALEHLNGDPDVKKLLKRISKYLANDSWKDTALVINCLESVGQIAENLDYAGVLLIVDEAGKTLEYGLQDREGGDVYIFQEIAEFANHQRALPFLFLITLHQMFDDYVELAERTIRAEWTKVQERFQSIQFLESPSTTMRIVTEAIRHKVEIPASVENEIDKVLSELESFSVPLPLGLDFNSFKGLAKRAWPLHPTTLLSIPHLFRRLAQNERSIFSFLTSHESYGFQEHIHAHRESLLEGNSFVRLCDLFSYFLSNFEAGLARLPHARRLLEANEIINSRQGLTERDSEIIRTIAMLNVLGDICPLRATPKMISASVAIKADIEPDLERLKGRSILTYRKLDASYRVWEGSDVDIEARMKEARRHLQMEGGSLIGNLKQYLPKKNLVARRHSFETGIHRYFILDYLEDVVGSKDIKPFFLKDPQSSGVVLVLLPHVDADQLLKDAIEATENDPRIILAIPRQIEALRVVAEEISCLMWVESHTEELRDDKVARRELSLRLAEAEQKINKLVQTLLDPRPFPSGNACLWVWNGEKQNLKTPTDVIHLLSKACETIYPLSPVLKNELIARTNISSAAAAARRKLMDLMLTKGEIEGLSIEGYPPERSIYESVLARTGIHEVDQTTGLAHFRTPPEKGQHNLYPVWDHLERRLFSGDTSRVDIQALFEEICKPPFGVPEGAIPLLFGAFFIQNKDELFLYHQGSFIPDPEPADFELLASRPDLFSISGSRLNGMRQVIVNRIAKGLNVSPKTAPVVRALCRIVFGLPQITLQTSRIGDKEAIRVRDIFLEAKSPDELLFRDLPDCFSLRPFLHDETREQDVDTFFNRLNACLEQLTRFHQVVLMDKRNVLLQKTNLTLDNSGWEDMIGMAELLVFRCKDENLLPFLNSVLSGSDNGNSSLPAISNVAGKPFELWSDREIDRFDGLAEGIAEQLKKAWRTFGNSLETPLSEREIAERDRLKNMILKDIPCNSPLYSRKVVLEALRSLIRDLEEPAEPEAMKVNLDQERGPN